MAKTQTTVTIDEDVLRQVMAATGTTTPEAAVEAAVEELMRTSGARALLNLAGKVEFHAGFLDEEAADRINLPNGRR